MTLAIMWAFHKVRRVDLLNTGFRRGQLISAAAFSLGHGANDAQKTMGVILAVLIAAGELDANADAPLWVVLSAWPSTRSPAAGGPASEPHAPVWFASG